MNDKQICAYCDEIRETTLKQLYKIQNQRKEISMLHKKCKSQQAEIERLEIKIEGVQEANAILREHIRKAVKEFAERLCEDRVSNDPVVIAVKVELEMVGAESG